MEKQSSSTSSFRNYFLFLLTTMVVVLSIGFALTKLLEERVIFSSEIHGASKINRHLTELHEDEIPIFGSSRADGGYVPSILGDQYYNYGIQGTQANVWLFFLENELKKSKTSDIIIDFGLTGFKSNLGDKGNYLPNFSATKELMGEEVEPLFYIPVVKYFGWFEDYTRLAVSERMQITKKTDRGGSFELGVLPADKFEKLVEERYKYPAQYSSGDTLRDRFHELIQSTTRKIYLVIAPYHKSVIESFINIEEINAYLEEVGRFPNVEVIDLRSIIEEDSLFFNTTHVNYEGAKIFSRRLAESIAD